MSYTKFFFVILVCISFSILMLGKTEAEGKDIKVMITDADSYSSELITKGENANLMEVSEYMSTGSAKAKKTILKDMIKDGWKIVYVDKATKLEYIFIFVKD